MAQEVKRVRPAIVKPKKSKEPKEPKEPKEQEESKEPEEPILSSNYWRYTKTFSSINEKETQIKYYTNNNATIEVLKLVQLDSKPFGSIIEGIICEIFQLKGRTSSENDAILYGKKIEIKSARYWGGKDDCRWQHLEPEHDYDYVLFVLLDFDSFKIYIVKKDKLMGELRDKKIVTPQGKQGFWTSKSKIIDYITQISTKEDLYNFILQE